MYQLRRPRNVLAALPIALLLGGCRGILAPAGPVGSAEKTLLLNSLAIMLAIVIPTILVTLTFAWWFRASNSRARYRPTFAYSGRLELIVWSIPALAIFFLGGVAWISSHELDPANPLPGKTPPIEVDVVALDWKWLFIYPQQGVASINRLVVPTGVPLHLRLTSATVLNVFFVPRLGSQIYTMNGMVAQLNLRADEPGVYPGLAAHFSGDGFSDMHFDVHAVSAADFTGWADRTRTSGPALDDASYRMLLRQTQNVAPYTYRSVEPGLFAAILRQKLPPGDGPARAEN
ncbi:MAG TPA: ubiquinol oxidase subunit II [Steroidobacteraceae bacterium]